MNEVPHFWPSVAALFAAIAAVLWFWSARVSVPAPPETAGVGALMGGYLISLDRKGRRIDLHKTLEQQSLWSARAAVAAGVAAILTAVAAFYP